MLADDFHISHTTVQFEHVSCAISETGCAIPVHVEEHGTTTRATSIIRGLVIMG